MVKNHVRAFCEAFESRGRKFYFGLFNSYSFVYSSVFSFFKPKQISWNIFSLGVLYVKKTLEQYSIMAYCFLVGTFSLSLSFGYSFNSLTLWGYLCSL